MTSETVRVAYACRQPAVEFFLNYEMDFNQAQSRQTTGLVQADFVWRGRASTVQASPAACLVAGLALSTWSEIAQLSFPYHVARRFSLDCALGSGGCGLVAPGASVPASIRLCRTTLYATLR